MYPLQETHLPLIKIARLWAHNIEGAPSESETFDFLLSAIWRRHLVIHEQGGHENEEELKKILLILARKEDHPGLFFLNKSDIIPSTQFLNEDGSVDVDLRLRLLLPEKAVSAVSPAWGSCFDTLQEATFEAYSPVVRPIFAGLMISKENFRNFCLQQNYALPVFWFKQQNQNVSMISQETACKKWFETEFTKDETQRTKPIWLQMAQTKFPELSKRAFSRIWDEKAPLSLKSPGRRAKKV